MNKKDLVHKETTDAIIGCAFDVMNELGQGFLESVYEKALYAALVDRGHEVRVQFPIAVMFRGICVGNFLADLLVDGKVIVELKTVKALSSEHKAQTINYLKATGVEVGLLINFGNRHVDFHRLNRPD